jgi:hypothetical protein
LAEVKTYYFMRGHIWKLGYSRLGSGTTKNKTPRHFQGLVELEKASTTHYLPSLKTNRTTHVRMWQMANPQTVKN